jgi:putative SOS response-associated peptidase YedK
MCGRYSLISNLQDLENRFEFTNEFIPHGSRFNIAPSQPVLSITNNGSNNQAHMMRWGLIPHWSKDAKITSALINARAETLDQKVSFREPFLTKRCIIPADGFYEWTRKDNKKIPMRITLKSEELFGFAGLWENWVADNATQFSTCTIITTRANQLISPIHHRMPVILPRESEHIWLDPTNQDLKTLKGLLTQYTSDDMATYPVSTLVNSPENDSSDVIAMWQTIS